MEWVYRAMLVVSPRKEAPKKTYSLDERIQLNNQTRELFKNSMILQYLKIKIENKIL